ncbi:MAG: YggS family pyridoxal phosphate-dependent enzyme [Bacteroidales bacterium]|nr:YggS family pyridoxal phosphate-dependent enzyme [Bacteroidales bacterium]
MSNTETYQNIRKTLPENVTLLAVSKTHPEEAIMDLYNIGCRDFGENKVQELTQKYNDLPKDIRWHQIGHLQTNKIKYIIPFVYMIHSVDSLKLAVEINKQAAKHNRVVNCLLQLKVACEETKFGFDSSEIVELMEQGAFRELKNIRICGLMGMATNTTDKDEIRNEFLEVNALFNRIKANYASEVGEGFAQISMGMSGDYPLAVECGSTIVRIGTILFGERDYSKKEDKA